MHWIKRHTALALFVLVVIVGFAFSSGIGPAWDEPDNMFAGGVYVNYFTHGADPMYFRILTDKASAYGDRIIPNDHLLSHYPPIPNYAGVLFVSAAGALHLQVTAPVIIRAWHLATVLFFALMVATTYRFGLLLGLSAGSSLFAAIGVFMYPQLFGHGLSNLKDTAQVTMVLTSLYYLVRATKDKVVKRKDLLIGAVVWGLGMATKFNAVYVPIIWGIWYFVTARKHIVFTAKYVLFIGIVGLATMFVVWPYLWFDPVGHFQEMIIYFLNIGRGFHILWNGVVYTVGMGKSLWWYPWASLLLTTPLTVLALIAVGIVALIRSVKQRVVLLLLPIWILVPMIRTLSPRTAFYDQIRHFLEILPALMLTTSLALDWVAHRWRLVAITVAVITVGQLIWINASLFPYSTGYYNMLARSQNTNFDRDIEGLSVKEGMDWLHLTYGAVAVWVPIAAHLSWPYLTTADRYIFTPEDGPDSIIVVNKQSHADSLRSLAALKNINLVHTISRGPAVLGWVYRRSSK
jgi:hypothetical protein